MSKHPAFKYKPTYALKAYKLIKSGLSFKNTCTALGIGLETGQRWIKMHPEFKEAVTEARADNSGYKEFKTFVMGRMPEEAAKLWDKLDELDSNVAVNGERKRSVFKLIDSSPVLIKMHLYIQALMSCNFIHSLAAKKIGVSNDEVEKWNKLEPNFKKLIGEIQRLKGDFFENCLLNLCQRGDSSAIIFANRTFNRDRGYNDKVTVEINKQVTHEHRVTLDDLSLEAKRELLEAHRRKQQLAIQDNSNVQDAEYEEVE